VPAMLSPQSGEAMQRNEIVTVTMRLRSIVNIWGFILGALFLTPGWVGSVAGA
jgi:hypothetical protein